MNLQVINQPPQTTMSSREIADLVDSRHDDVKRSIERLAGKGVIQLPPMADVKNHKGQTVSEYRIGKRDSYVIVAQLSPEFTARLVDRWQELESSQALALPQTFAEALRLAADQHEQIEQQKVQLAIAAPKVEFVDMYVDATGLKGFRQVAKLLKASEPKLSAYLIAEKIMYRLGGTLTPYANHIEAGRFSVKTGASDGGHAFNQSMFTAKGVNWIAGLWAQHCVASSV